jgi:hypothetical protein
MGGDFSGNTERERGLCVYVKKREDLLLSSLFTQQALVFLRVVLAVQYGDK